MKTRETVKVHVTYHSDESASSIPVAGNCRQKTFPTGRIFLAHTINRELLVDYVVDLNRGSMLK